MGNVESNSARSELGDSTVPVNGHPDDNQQTITHNEFTSDLCCIYYSKTEEIPARVNALFQKFIHRGFKLETHNISTETDTSYLRSSQTIVMFSSMEMIDHIWEHAGVLEDAKRRDFMHVFTEKEVKASPIMKGLNFIDISDTTVAEFLHEGEVVSTIMSRIDETLQMKTSAAALYQFLVSFNALVHRHQTEADLDFSKYSGLIQFSTSASGKITTVNLRISSISILKINICHADVVSSGFDVLQNFLAACELPARVLHFLCQERSQLLEHSVVFNSTGSFIEVIGADYESGFADTAELLEEPTFRLFYKVQQKVSESCSHRLLYASVSMIQLYIYLASTPAMEVDDTLLTLKHFIMFMHSLTFNNPSAVDLLSVFIENLSSDFFLMYKVQGKSSPSEIFDIISRGFGVKLQVLDILVNAINFLYSARRRNLQATVIVVAENRKVAIPSINYDLCVDLERIGSKQSQALSYTINIDSLLFLVFDVFESVLEARLKKPTNSESCTKDFLTTASTTCVDIATFYIREGNSKNLTVLLRSLCIMSKMNKHELCESTISNGLLALLFQIFEMESLPNVEMITISIILLTINIEVNSNVFDCLLSGKTLKQIFHHAKRLYKDEEFAKAFLKFIARLSSGSVEVTENALRVSELVGILEKCLELYTGYNLLLAIVVIGNITVSSSVAQIIADSPKIASLMIRSLLNNANDGFIVTSLLKAMSHLSKKPKFAQAIWSNGFSAVILDIFSNLSSDDMVINALMIMLGNLAVVSSLSRSQLQSNKLIITAICQSLKIFVVQNQSNIVENGCVLLANLCVESECRIALAEGGACDILVDALSSYCDSPSTVEQCCIAITNLSLNNSSNCMALGSAGICDLLCNILEKHKNLDDVMEEALAAVATLSTFGRSLKIHSKMLSCGICGPTDVNLQAVDSLNLGRSQKSLIVTIFLNFVQKSTVSSTLEQCLKAIGNLALDDKCRASLGSTGACVALSLWLRHHYSIACSKDPTATWSSGDFSKVQVLTMDEDEMTVNSTVSLRNIASSDIINSRIFEAGAANTLEAACTAITNLACNTPEHKACFVQYKVHSIIRMIIKTAYHQKLSNVQSSRTADDHLSMTLSIPKKFEPLISLLRSTYNIVKSSGSINSEQSGSELKSPNSSNTGSSPPPFKSAVSGRRESLSFGPSRYHDSFH